MTALGIILGMDSATAQRLLALNREFYTRFGDSFSATRQRIQPGARRVLEMLNGDEDILDLGCGNGELARALAKRGHHGSYLGVDFSLPLLRNAQSTPSTFSARFVEADLTTLTADNPPLSASSFFPLSSFDIVFSFAVLHHIPSTDLRLSLLQTVHQLLKPTGFFIHSNWQFINSEKLKARIQPWDVVAGLGSKVDAGDYLLDWRSGGQGLRYVHHFSEAELHELAEATGFQVKDVFYSDGETGNLGLYEVWQPVL